ncbi:hypothetical protein K9N68_39325 (plasmid) [Kovacikia minuta CCNUW1]|uniref:hypothetical protein n=1 Tax=Kovacikia minuta TaxID=2931930 RepID=UPI001CCA2CCA|nr:hypothetical protein [Kovacikia minuta]UBF30190.1 hypothetical protein K9N68_39325 [Kovacikia minuta CCNUW1]
MTDYQPDPAAQPELEDRSAQYVVPPDSLKYWRYTVYFEGLALWKEQDPQKRVVMARQLAEWTHTLAQKEAEAAQQSSLPPSPSR